MTTTYGESGSERVGGREKDSSVEELCGSLGVVLMPLARLFNSGNTF